MKILTICSNEYPAPPPPNVIHASLYISSVLAEGLAKKHHVTFISAQGSTITTRRAHPNTKPFFETIKKEEWQSLLDKRLMGQLIVPFETDLHLKLIEVLQNERFDLVHFHSTPPFYGLPFAMRTRLPNIFTLHGISSPPELKVIKTFNSRNNYFISISNKQREEFPGLNFIKTIYHGIPLEHAEFNSAGGHEMVFTSRLKKVKGVEEAILVALKTKRHLKLAGDVRGSEKDYFYETILPMIENSGGLVKFLNFVDRSMVSRFFGQGKLFIFPLKWEEAFGLVLLDSMAVGTPVVAFAKGSIPEVIIDGETGFIVNPSDEDIRGNFLIKKTGIDGLCEAVERIYAMPRGLYQKMRKACRLHVESRFTVEQMVDAYEKVYQSMLQR